MHRSQNCPARCYPRYGHVFQGNVAIYQIETDMDSVLQIWTFQFQARCPPEGPLSRIEICSLRGLSRNMAAQPSKSTINFIQGELTAASQGTDDGT